MIAYNSFTFYISFNTV
uniref:Uncharacterized protein n=1 Tax=Anguilla anguilla TaxID=7936 RepID=A0A0E9RYJ2_ANGAN